MPWYSVADILLSVHRQFGSWRQDYSLIDAEFNSRLTPGKKAVIVTSQGDPDLASFEKAATEFSGILLLLGFEVTETIRMGMRAKDAAWEERISWIRPGPRIGPLNTWKMR